MLPEIAYQKFIIKINKNAQTNNIACDKGRFVLIYNESQNKEIEYILEKRANDSIRYIQKLLVPSKLLKSKKKDKSFDLFTLPEDFFDFSTLFGMATKECCKEVSLDMYEIKSENENLVTFDEFQKPSFEFREAPYYISQDSIKVFKDDFEYNGLHLTYYRYPKQISLKNPENPESNFSKQEIELDDKIVDRIISRASAEFEMNNSNPKYQVDLQRTIQK
jgi:hypothetical protein